MKFKIASILELVTPLSVAALMLSAFSGCGGGGDYGAGANAYDGLWAATYEVPEPAAGGTSAVVAAGLTPVTLTLKHGFGHMVAERDFEYGYLNPTGWATYTMAMDIQVTYGSLASQSAVINIDVNGGAHLTGTCDTPISCVATGFYMTRQ